jgi:hypothetical protein
MLLLDRTVGAGAFVGEGGRHADVDDGEIGLFLCDGGEQLVGVAEGGDDVMAAVPEEAGEAFAQQRLVLGNRLVWQLAAEHLLIAALPKVERWTPWGATSGLLQLGPAGISSGTLLAAPIGGLFLVGYTAAAAALALVVAPRRDVL